MLFFKKKKKVEDFYFVSPAKGELMPLENVKDEAFASGMLGKGFAIEPSEGLVCMPFDGEIVMLFPTKHAVGLKDAYGNEYLIHIGIDTVNLNGEGFSAYVKSGDHCKAGAKLVAFPIDLIKDQGYEATIMIVKTSSVTSEAFELKETRIIDYKEPLIEIRK